jgi:hypothetical protein
LHNTIHSCRRDEVGDDMNRTASVVFKYTSWVFTAPAVHFLADSNQLKVAVTQYGPPLWSSCQSSWLLTQRSRVRFSALLDFLSSSGYGTGVTQTL